MPRKVSLFDYETQRSKKWDKIKDLYGSGPLKRLWTGTGLKRGTVLRLIEEKRKEYASKANTQAEARQVP